ncbi:MAG: efflux RND transporter permease subunit, partial [Desulfobulbaceae bacterium]|nr:efflux RND transporter permease subunit [Desulfobulbaceae bacterium]
CQEIKDAVDRISSFPEDAEEPRVAAAKRKRYVVSLALFGDQPESVLREQAEIIRDQLLQDPGISQVELEGVRDYEISIEIPQKMLRTYDLTLQTVADAIGRASVEIPGGAVKTAAGDVLVRVAERRTLGREFGKLPVITGADGTEVLLEDIATIKDDFAETDSFATFNGHPCVMISVYRVGEQTPISVSDAVHQQLTTINRNLPTGLSILPRSDRSEIYRQRLELMLNNAYMGLALVFILLAIFLEARLAFWVSLGIPISFLGAFVFLPLLGVSINMISMFAFIITLGIVVDDAVVVGENVYHYRQRGLGWFAAAIKGVREVATPVIFSVLTNIVAFMPLYFVPGFMGKIFRQIPLVVLVVFSISLIESLFILPAHLGHQKTTFKPGKLSFLVEYQQRFSTAFANFIHQRYKPFLTFTLHWRYISLAIGLAVLIIAFGFIKSGRMGFELFPKMESDYAKVTAILPFGTAVEKTSAIQEKLVAAGAAIAEENGGERLVEGIYARINGNTSQIQIYLTPPKERPISTAEVIRLWRQRVGELAGLESLKFESDAGGPGGGAAIAVELSHRQIAVLEQAGAGLAESLSFYPKTLDIDDGFSPGKQQLDFKILPQGQSLGLNASNVARQVRHAYYGAQALRQQRGRNEVKTMVRLPREERSSEYFLEEMMLRTPDGGEIPLREAVRITRGRADPSIERRDGRRIITVAADVRPRSEAGQIMASLREEVLPKLQQQFPGLSYSFEGRMADRRESVQSLMRGLLVSMLIIFAMLAIPMNSYIQPIIIMIAIPFGLVGAVIGHLIMGYSLSVLSLFGLVALSGVVVNDSLVLIDFANHRCHKGLVAREAIIEAATQRFRPILLTTLTTFGGLAPIIFETSRQARFLIPMAVSLGYGILFATIITLVIVPTLYMIIEDVRGIFRATPESE